MTFLEHLEELRRRLLRAVAAVCVCSLLGLFVLDDAAMLVVRAPLDALDPATRNPLARCNPLVGGMRPVLAPEGTGAAPALYTTTAMEPLAVKFRLALFAGLLLAAPYVLWEAWAFVRAGLTDRERHAVRRALPLSGLLFVLGVLFGYFGAVPVGLLFLLSVEPSIQRILTIGPYVNMVVWMTLLFGLAFQGPLVMKAAVRLGLVTTSDLARGRRLAIVLIFVAAAVLTPPDPISQCLLAVPLVALYELGVLLARLGERAR